MHTHICAYSHDILVPTLSIKLKIKQEKGNTQKRIDDDLLKQPGDIFPGEFLCLRKTNQFPGSPSLKLAFTSV